jgi:predicted glycosyltransferase
MIQDSDYQKVKTRLQRSRDTAMRFLLYSHDGFGLGHTRRHLAIAAALTELAPQASVLLTSGLDDVYRLGLPPRVEVLKLPGLRKVGNDQYVSRRLRLPTAEIRALRSAVLETAAKTFRPTVTLVDKHPFGACGEFRDALQAIKHASARTVLGLRDILDDRAAVLREWSAQDLSESVAQYYDLVLVYGEPLVLDPTSEYKFPEALTERTRFCGYVVGREQADLRSDIQWTTLKPRPRKRPVVLATTGGGEDGFFLLATFTQAATRANWQAVVIAGPLTPASELEKLQRLASKARVALHTFVPNLSALFGSADALVCMGGYNTLSEAVSKGVPTVCVPRIAPRLEQLLRARAFERLGLLRWIHPSQLTVEVLRDVVQAALATPRQELLDRANAALSFNGAHCAASHLLRLATDKTAPQTMLARSD